MEHGHSLVTDEMRADFADHGVVKVPEALDPAWFDGLLAYAEEELAHPGRWNSDTNPGGRTNRLFTSRYNWPHNDFLRRFVFESGMGELAADLMGSRTARIFFEHLLVKEPHTTAPTPWHQDIPYWPFLGEQIASVWVALTPATVKESALEFVRGSHRGGHYYAPVSFADTPSFLDDFEGEECPDIEADRDAYDIVSWEVEPGDALVFSAWIVHGSPANQADHRRVAISTRWLGDSAVWYPHPGADPIISQEQMGVAPGEYPHSDAVPLVVDNR